MKQNLMTAAEVAEYLRVRPPSVYEWAKGGKIPCAKVGRLWRFHREEIEAWVRKGGLQNPTEKKKRRRQRQS